MVQLYEPQPHEVLILCLLCNAGVFKFLELTKGSDADSTSHVTTILALNLLYTATLL